MKKNPSKSVWGWRAPHRIAHPENALRPLNVEEARVGVSGTEEEKAKYGWTEKTEFKHIKNKPAFGALLT